MNCSAFWLDFPLYYVVVVLATSVLCCCYVLHAANSSDQRIFTKTNAHLLLLVMWPTLDLGTDIGYLFVTYFPRPELFWLCVLIISLSIIPHGLFLFQQRAMPLVWFSNASFSRVDSLPKFLAHLVWLLVQCTWVLPVNAPLFLLGCILSTTKLMCVSWVRSWWFSWWTWSSELYLERGRFDVELYNQTKHMDVFLESLPQLVLQCVVAYLSLEITPMFLVSASFSAMTSLDLAYNFVYFVLYRGMDWAAVPVSSIVFGELDVKGIEGSIYTPIMGFNEETRVDANQRQFSAETSNFRL
jgi:hypothetical protein